MKTLYLHIGHSKTGSSWLQQFLFLNRQRLGEKGLLYWFDEPELNQPDYPTPIHWGNGKNVFASRTKLETYFNALPEADAVLLSAEEIFYDLIYWRRIAFPIDYFRSKGFTQIKILLFIRNPIEQIYSIWAETLKNDWFLHHSTLEEAFQHNRKPVLVARLMELLKSFPEVELTIRNYSRCTKRLDRELLDWLNIDRNGFQQPVNSVVNRSLTHSEILILRALKAAGYPHIWPMTQTMMSFQPSYPIQKFYPKTDIQQAYFKQIQPALEVVNTSLPPAQQYGARLEEHIPPDQRLVYLDQPEWNAILQKLGLPAERNEEPVLRFTEAEWMEKIQGYIPQIPDRQDFRVTDQRTLFIYTHEAQPGGASPALFPLPDLFAPYSSILDLMPVSRQFHTHTHFVICPKLTDNLLAAREMDPLKIETDLEHIRTFGYHRIYVCWPNPEYRRY